MARLLGASSIWWLVKIEIDIFLSKMARDDRRCSKYDVTSNAKALCTDIPYWEINIIVLWTKLGRGLLKPFKFYDHISIHINMRVNHYLFNLPPPPPRPLLIIKPVNNLMYKANTTNQPKHILCFWLSSTCQKVFGNKYLKLEELWIDNICIYIK